MMYSKLHKIFIVFILIFIYFVASFFQVNEVQNAFIVRFGKVVSVVDKAGLHFKTPLLDEIVYFDKRILQVRTPTREVIASDQKRLIIDVYAKYQIIDTKKFYESVRNEYGANLRISSILDSTMRQVIAKRPLISLLTTDRSSIMDEIQDILGKQSAEFGVKIIDVRIIKAELPDENSKAVFKRMITDRDKEAKELRAEGFEESQIIMATADKKATTLKSQAILEAAKIIAKADAEAMKIYNNSFAKDVEFYKFYRTLEIYKKDLGKHNLVFSTSDEFLQLLRESAK